MTPRSRRTIEMLVSSSVGLLALFVSAYTVHIQRQQLKVQAWPRLTFETDLLPPAKPNQLHFTLSIRNRGVAPAEVRAMRLAIAGQPVTEWLEWLNQLKRKHGLAAPIQLSKANSPIGKVIGVGQELTVLESESVEAAALINSDDELSMSICYCSMLDDCWVLDVSPSGDQSTSSIARCPTYAPKFVGVSEATSRAWAERALKRAANGNAAAEVNK